MRANIRESVVLVQTKVKKAASELADAAKAKDHEAITTKVKALGDACVACHKVFRAEKYAE